MDFQPPNLFVRQCEFYGDTGKFPGFRCFHYFFNGPSKQWIMKPWKVSKSIKLWKPIWLTPWEYYDAREARLALSLPGREPTHKLVLTLPEDAELYGPCFVAPLERARVDFDIDLGRPGNGTEYMLKGPFPLEFNLQQYSVERM